MGIFGVMGLVACAASFAWIVIGSAAGLGLRALADIADEVRWARMAAQR